MKNILIYGQTDENGVLKRGCLELISLAQKISEDGKISMVLFGDESMTARKQAAEHGITHLIIIKDEKEIHMSLIKPYGKAIKKILDEEYFDVLLISATPVGRDIAPYVANLGGYAMMSHCLDAHLTKAGTIVWSGAGFGGTLRTKATFDGEGTQIVTVRPGLFSVPEPVTDTTCEVEVRESVLQPDDLLSLIRILKKSEIIDLESAEVVVAGGKGTGGERGFALIRDLADAFGGVVGASRQAVDRGWIGHEHLVGQSGKIISPKLYIACGIAGYVQHLTGMRDSGFIVSINTDPRALIYDVSDVCVVGDMFEVLPPLITEVKKIRG